MTILMNNGANQIMMSTDRRTTSLFVGGTRYIMLIESCEKLKILCISVSFLFLLIDEYGYFKKIIFTEIIGFLSQSFTFVTFKY